MDNITIFMGILIASLSLFYAIYSRNVNNKREEINKRNDEILNDNKNNFEYYFNELDKSNPDVEIFHEFVKHFSLFKKNVKEMKKGDEHMMKIIFYNEEKEKILSIFKNKNLTPEEGFILSWIKKYEEDI